MKPIENTIKSRHHIGDLRYGEKIVGTRPCLHYPRCLDPRRDKCEGVGIRLENFTFFFCGYYGLP